MVKECDEIEAKSYLLTAFSLIKDKNEAILLSQYNVNLQRKNIEFV